MLEVTERERVVTLAEIEKEKAIEVEKKTIQDVIRERVMVERAVVEEEEKIKDTHEFATADRAKKVAVTTAEEKAKQALVKKFKPPKPRNRRPSGMRNSYHHRQPRPIGRRRKSKPTPRKCWPKPLSAETPHRLGRSRSRYAARPTRSKKQGTAEAVVVQKKVEAEAKG